ncbi:MAG: T9SS type A sorting domain-containing protein [Ignavibacteria bacterium]|nr:T9SS type A sorting domain-containing protein [Ignavibacteria bacterium]
MNRFDSAFSSRQRSVGRWLQALLLTVITTAGLLTGISVKAQTVDLLASPGPNPVCAGQNTTLRATLAAPGINIGYAALGVLPPYAFALPGGGVVNLALDDDEVSAEQNVAGQFRFHGRLIDLAVDGFYVGSNGFITFRNDPLAVQIAPRNLAAPGAGATYDAIYLANTDLSPQVGGQIWYELVGTTLIVTFDDVPYFYPNPPGPIPPGAPNPATVSVQLVLHLEGDANPGQIDIFVEQIDDNALNVQAAQDQHSIGLLSLCQPPQATIGQNQRAGAGGPFGPEVYSWEPAAPALDGTQTAFFRCPTPNVPCAGVGGIAIGTAVNAGPIWNQVTATPAATVDRTWYYYGITTLNNCTTVQTADYAVVANAQPVAIGSITGTQNICQGATVQYVAVPSIATSTLAWSTTAPGATIILSGAQNQIADIQYPAGGSNAGTSYNIQVTETGPAPTNCSAISTFVNRVTIYSVPVGPLTVAPGAICAVATGSNNVTYSTPAGYGSYAWAFVTNTIGATFPAGSTNTKVVTVTNQPVQPAAAATVTVQVQAFNGPGNLCPGPVLQTSFTVNPLPPTNAVAGSVASVCAGTNMTYSITNNGGTGLVGVAGNTYTYTASGLPFVYTGGSAGYPNGTPLAANVVANQSRQLNWTAAGTGTMTVLETTASGCTRTYSTTTTVNPLPTPSIVGSNTPCQFVPATLGNPSYQSAPNPIQYSYTLNTVTVGNSYRWAVTGGGGTIVAANAATTTALPATSTTTPGNVNLGVSLITVQWSAPGAGTVTVDERTALGCNASSTLNVTVIATPPTGAFVLTGALATCASPAAPVAYTATGAGSHSFTISGGTPQAPFVGGYALGGPGVTGVGPGGFSVQWGAAGTGTISHEYTEGGCAAVKTYTITINPNPTFSIGAPAPTLCGNQAHTFSTLALVNGGGAPTYLWAEALDVDGIGTLGVNNNPTMIVTFTNPPAATSSYSLTLTVTNTTTTCAATVTQAFTINQVPSAPVITPVATACAASPQNPVSTTNYTITTAQAGSLAVNVTGAPVGTVVTGSPFAQPVGAVARTITWGQLPQNAALVPQSVVVTINAQLTSAAGCVSLVGSTNTTFYARPAPAPITFAPVLPFCVNTPVPINVAVATNGGAGQPGVNYVWVPGGGIVLNAAGPAPDLTRQITNLGGAGPKSITVTGVDAISGCGTSTVTNFVVDPVPTPSIVINVPTAGLNPNVVCQNLVDPVGMPHAGPFTYTYDFATPQVLGNTYSWQISNGYIVAYSTNNGGAYTTIAGNVAPVASQLLPGTLNASRVRVVFYGASPAKIKVTEVHPGGCGATTPDYNVTLNVIPTQYALGVTPQDICNTGAQTAPLTLANSQVGYSYQVQRSTNGGGTWANATVAAQNGTGAALNFVVPTADLAFTTVAPAPTVYLFRVVASNLAPVCGPYIVSTGDATVNVHQIPNAALAVTIAPTPVCFGDLVNVTVAGSENWVTYELFRRQIRDNATGAALPPAAFVSTGISAVGTGGALLLADNTNPVGGYPLLAAANYEYEVVATSNTNPPACFVILTQHPTATVFALPLVQANSYTPNPVCWEQPVIFTQAGSQDGVTYEILRNGVSMAPAVTFNGTGGAIGPISIPALSVLPTNPAVPTIVNFEVRAQLRTGAGVYARPIPASACPVSDAPGTDVTVNPKPVASFSGSNPACGPSVGTYTAATPSFGGWAATYDWKILGVVDNTVEIPVTTNPPTGTTPLVGNNTGFGTLNPFVTTWGTHLLSCNGVYNPLPVKVRMIETNVFGCPDTAVVTVTINPTVADATISGPTTACIYGGFEEHLTTYTVARAPGCVFPAGTTYLWNMPTGPVVGVIRSGQNTTSIVTEWHATGGTNIGQIQLAVTLPPSHGGCVTNLTYNVTVYPQPQPVITGPTQVCQNSTGSPTSTSIYTATLFTGDTYKWDVVGGTITTPGGATGTGVVGNPSTITAVNGNSITVTWGTTPNPNATITLTQTSVVGCLNRTTLNVNVNPTPNPVINGPGVVCDNAVASYSTANNAPANSYAWTMLGGSNATITAGANQATATVLTGAIGGGNSFTLQLVETTNATTCSKTVTRTITIVPTPAPTITRLTPGGATGGSCLNQVIQYGQTDPTAGTFSYKWTATSGIISDVTGNNPGPDNGTTVYVKWNTVGTGTITLAKWHTSSQCTTTVSQNVTITNPPAPAITGPTNVCGEQIATYSTPNVVGNTYSWSFSNGSIVSGSGTNALTIKFTNPGVGSTLSSNVTVTETNTLSGCTGSATVLVTIRYQPQVQTITGPTQVCAYNAVTNPGNVAYSVANNIGATYQWTVTGATIVSGATTNAVQVRWTTIGTQTLTVVEKEATGLCSATSTLNVAVTYMPAPSITGNLNACSNSAETYSTPAVAGSTYAWTVSGTVADRTTSGLTNNSITVQWLTAGTRTLTVIETAGLCTATATANVTVTAKPAPVITRVSPLGLLNQACLDETITYSTPNGGSTTYLWTVTGGTITGVNNANAVTINWTAIGNQTLSVVETSTVNTGCVGTTSLSVSVEEQPNPVISGGTPVCSGSTQTYSVTAVAGHTYNWSITGLASDRTITTSVTGSSMSVTWNNAGSYTVSVLQTNNSGNCSRTANLVVTVQQTPTATAISRVSGTPLNQACNGETISYSTPANGASSYLWTVVGGSINGSATGNVVSVTWQTVGNNTITVTETTTGTPCFKTVTENVAVTRMPTPTISGNLNACSNSTEVYSTPAQAGSTYAWTVSGTATDRTIASGTTNNTITVLWLTAGTRTLTVTETAGLCVVTTTANVTVTAKPTPVITRTSPAGLLNQACLDETITYSTPNLGGTTYLWTVTGGTITGVNNANAVTVNWTALGNQTLTVVETATANTGCVGTTSLNVSVEEQPNPVISGGTPVCSGTTQTYSVTAVPGHTYNWTIGGTAADRTIVSSITGSSVTVTWNNAGTYAVGVTQTNVSGNCFRSATLNVTVQQTPTATAISRVTPGGAVNQACQGQTITYSTPFVGTSSYLWTATGGVINGTATANTVSVTWQTIGNNTLTVTETTTGTPCFKTVTQNVAVSYTPTPNITGSTVVCINKEHTYSTPAVPGSTYNWVITPTNAFATIAGYPTSNTITVRWIQPGLHTMSVTETALGGFCFTTTTVNIRVNPIPTPDIQSATGYGNPITRRPGIVCNNSTHVYSVTPTPGNVFQWVVTGGTITAGSNTNQITVLWGAAGNGTIACTETVPGSDCITTDTDTILIRPTPTPVVTGQVNPCGNSVQDYTTPFVSGNAYTWTVVGGTYVNLAPNTIRVTWSAPVWPNTTAATVSVREDVADVLPAGTCFGVNTLNVTIRPIPPTPSITGPSPVCATDLSDSPATINTATYTSSIPVITAGSGSLQPSWTVTNGVIVSGQGTLTIGVQWANSGLTPITGNLTVTHTSSFGCSATGSLSVTINPLPNPVISGPRSACQNSLQNYSTPGIPGNTYSWAVSGGNIIRAGQGTPNVTVEWTLPGAATLTVTEVNGFLCTVLNTINVTVNALPNAVLTASGQTTFCQGGDVTLSAPIGFSSYIWNTGETARSIVVRTTGKYWCTVTDENGCSNSSDTIQVNVFPSTLPIIAINAPTTFCEGGSVTLTAPSGFNAYLWSNGAQTQSIVVTQSGSYTVTVADNNGCTGTSTEVDVVVNPTPAPVLTLIGSANLCSGDSVEVRAPAGFVSYTWVSTSGTNYGTSRSIIIRQTDTVYCQVVDVNGCVGSSDTVGITVAPVAPPVITANGPTTFCEGGAVTLTAPAGYASYIWSNGSTGRTITVQNGGEFWVTVTNNTSCPANSTKTVVTVNSLPVIPTISRMGDVLTANSAVAQSWQWFRNGTMIAGATAKTYTVALPGSYRVEIADNNTCASVSEAFDVILTDVDEDVVAGRQAELRVFPNPSNGQFSIETTITQAGPVRIELVNAVGELVMTLNEAANGGAFRTSVDMGILANGVYNVVVTTGSERWVVRLVRR